MNDREPFRLQTHLARQRWDHVGNESIWESMWMGDALVDLRGKKPARTDAQIEDHYHGLGYGVVHVVDAYDPSGNQLPEVRRVYARRM